MSITEGGLLSDAAGAPPRLARLRSERTRIAVDDRGSGNTPQLITTLAPELAKIDRLLVRNTAGTERASIVVKAVVAPARELGVSIVAEGVETTDQLALLPDCGCGAFQASFGSAPQEGLTAFTAAA